MKTCDKCGHTRGSTKCIAVCVDGIAQERIALLKKCDDAKRIALGKRNAEIEELHKRLERKDLRIERLGKVRESMKKQIERLERVNQARQNTICSLDNRIAALELRFQFLDVDHTESIRQVTKLKKYIIDNIVSD